MALTRDRDSVGGGQPPSSVHSEAPSFKPFCPIGLTLAKISLMLPVDMATSCGCVLRTRMSSDAFSLQAGMLASDIA